MLRFALLIGSFLACGWAVAEPAVYNRVDFQVEAAREVANDLLTATLVVDIQDKQPARVAQQMNAALNDALKKAAAFSAVKASSGNQHTFPVYGRNNQIAKDIQHESTLATYRIPPGGISQNVRSHESR